jgi:hypothetical protein
VLPKQSDLSQISAKYCGPFAWQYWNRPKRAAGIRVAPAPGVCNAQLV